MSRTIKEIYAEAVRERNRRMELSEFKSDSKMSILNGITWAFSAVVYSFETLLDVFAMDISAAINSRINGTPAYYANALLQYQKGDTLSVREDGLAFGYASIDETKRIVTQVSYAESSDNVNLDSKLILKVATGSKGNLSPVSAEDLVMLNAYIAQIKFAGTRVEVTSRKGDVLIPRLSVFYDGALPEAGIYDQIAEKLNEYVMNIDFDAGVYVSKIIDAIKKVEHVTDVYIDANAVPEQGIFLACYDADGHIQPERKINRMTHTASGYVRESTGKGDEQDLPNFKQAVKLIIDNGCDTDCLQTVQ
jgi:hypothetical protein